MARPDRRPVYTDPAFSVPAVAARQVARVEAVMRERHKYWARFPERYSVEGEVRHWIAGVWHRIMSDGYLADEYEHELDLRRAVQRFLDIADEQGLAEVTRWLVPIVERVDEQFRAITTEDTERWVMKAPPWIEDASRDEPDHWWYRHLTTNPDTLADYARIHGASGSVQPDD